MSWLFLFFGLLLVSTLLSGRSAPRARPTRSIRVSSPFETIVALAGRIPGATLIGSTLTGFYEGRGIQIVLAEDAYEISIEGVPVAFGLEGADALARIDSAARTMELADRHPEWVELRRALGPIRFEHGRLVATAHPEPGAVHLRRLVDLLVDSTRLVRRRLVKRLRVTRTRCPYCHDGVGAESLSRGCPRCGARHHLECYTEHGRCAVYACSRLAG